MVGIGRFDAMINDFRGSELVSFYADKVDDESLAEERRQDHKKVGGISYQQLFVLVTTAEFMAETVGYRVQLACSTHMLSILSIAAVEDTRMG